MAATIRQLTYSPGRGRGALRCGPGGPDLHGSRSCSHAGVARLFDGLEMVEPGLVPVQEWRARSAADAGTRPAMWGGVGHGRRAAAGYCRPGAGSDLERELGQ